MLFKDFKTKNWVCYELILYITKSFSLPVSQQEAPQIENRKEAVS